jgi:hypothetical protein
MSLHRKVRTGARYRFDPVPMDRFDPPYDVKAGETVVVVRPHGYPAPNTMGHCHVNVRRGGEWVFGGLVCCNSLQPID